MYEVIRTYCTSHPVISTRQVENSISAGKTWMRLKTGKQEPWENAVAEDNAPQSKTYVLHTACTKEHEPKEFTVYHGTRKHNDNAGLICSCVRGRNKQGNAKLDSTTICTTFACRNIRDCVQFHGRPARRKNRQTLINRDILTVRDSYKKILKNLCCF